jgi:hypothetical protein
VLQVGAVHIEEHRLAGEPGSRQDDLRRTTGFDHATAHCDLAVQITAKLDKLTIKVDLPKLSPDDIKRLETAVRDNRTSE